MKNKHTNTIQKRNILARALDVPVASLSLSTDTFYGAFLSLAAVVTVLLYGASGAVANTEIAITPVINPRQVMLENKVEKLVGDYPIAQMAEIIAKQDKTTAAFLVGIAKKESNWGKRVPRAEDGSDCYNYWGYRGAGSRGIAMGHGCFGSPEEAVGVVGGRIDTLVHEYNFRTAAEMVVWKCGWSCDGHSNQSVKKWIADVALYKQKIAN
ncbi:MAG: hypothetical protein E6Q53_02370 [Candidatus Moraniibacteriota bacterium]|nr:MAG: hypothetical protein E6Q53_02370 [Candidatus Moranbacteria bacterium]